MAPAKPVLKAVPQPLTLGPTIDWQALSQTVAHYAGLGYNYTETPWTVPRHITEITFPDAYAALGQGPDDLLGSSEQAFLQLALEGGLEPGRYCALTPCFRNEAVHTATHRPYFMKVELFDTEAPTPERLDATVAQCLEWFKQLTQGQGLLEVVKTESGFDINLNGIEIGSYGIRTHNGLTWLYATGLAEPRFSVALKNS